MPIRIETIVATLPPDFGFLRADARAAGYRHIERLALDWDSGPLRFERDGEALLAAYFDDELVGIGGLTQDPSLPEALRLRRFYVMARFRRLGVGRALAEALIARARALNRPVTVNAAPGSAQFWEALGFMPDPRHGHTHILPTGAATR